MALQAIKERILPEERLKKHVREALNIADKIVIETKARQINVKKCSEYQEGMLNRLHNVMDGAIKVGNKGLYKSTAPLANVVGQWHSVTVQMLNDESTMVEFVSMIKTFYKAVVEYRSIVRDFNRTAKDFTSLKAFGATIPDELSKTSMDAAKTFQELVDSIRTIEVRYTNLPDVVSVDDEDKWDKKFEEERQVFLQKSGVINNKEGD